MNDTKAAELAEKLQDADLSLWQSYCDKKAEAEELREQMQQVAEQILRNDREGVVAWAKGVHLSMDDDGSVSLRAIEERVPDDGWLISGGLLYRLTDERQPQNRDEINITMADGSRSDEARNRRARELLDRIRASASSEGGRP